MIKAKIIADSLSPQGKRITTFELEYCRFLHAEFMTHRAISKNSSSYSINNAFFVVAISFNLPPDF